MSEPDRSFLPTKPGQSVLVYALNALLLANLTVIVLIMSGQLLGEDEQDVAPANQAQAPHVESAPVVQVEPQPAQVGTRDALVTEPVVSTAAGQPAPSPVEPVQHDATREATPVVSEPPLTFFGIGLE